MQEVREAPQRASPIPLPTMRKDLYRRTLTAIWRDDRSRR
jgi:hypothetical protein